MNTSYRTEAPAIKNPVEFDLKLPPYTLYTLKNGVEVFSWDLGIEDTLMVNWVFYAGNSYEKKDMVSAATNHLLKNGTNKRNAFDFNEHFEYFGAYLSKACYNETADITLHCLTKHTHELLPAVAEMIQEANYPEDEIEIYKKSMKQRLEVNLKKSEFVASRMVDIYLFGENHPYGKYSTTEGYDSLQREDLLAFHNEYYKNGHCVIFTAGKLPPDMMQQLEEHFGSLPLKPKPAYESLPTPAFERATTKKYRIQNDENGVQGSIRIASPFPNRHHPDFQKMQVLNNVFGGYFGSRLMNNIREDKGYTYGIYSYQLNFMQESGIMISTEAGKDVCEATIQEVYHEMEKLRKKVVGKEELMMARNYLIGLILGDLDGPFQVASRWKNIILNGFNESYFYRGIDIIKNISPEELKELANKYLQPDNFYELVVI